VDEYRCQIRGGKGVKTINVTDKNGELAKLISVTEGEDLLVVSDKGIIIRTPINQISILKRATQGVKIINLLEDHVVSTVALIDSEPEEVEFDETIKEEIPLMPVDSHLPIDDEEIEDDVVIAEPEDQEVEEENEEDTDIEDILNDSF